MSRRRFARQRLHPGHHLGVMDPGPPRTFPVPESWEAFLAEPFPPTRHHVHMNTQRGSDIDVPVAVGSHQHDPGPNHLTMRSGIRTRTAHQHGPHLLGQHHHKRGTTRHTDLPAATARLPRSPPTYTDVIIGMPTSRQSARRNRRRNRRRCPRRRTAETWSRRRPGRSPVRRPSPRCHRSATAPTARPDRRRG